jgi:MFS family permease
MLPLEEAFGWSRSTVSFAAGVGILFYGLTGPFAAALMQGMGVRRVVLGALALMAAATLASTLMREPWQYVATWGVAAGIGSGALAMTLAATVVNRWFVARRSLMMGLLTAATATGNLIFLPVLALLAEDGGWRRAAAATGLVALALIPLVWRFLPERARPMAMWSLRRRREACFRWPLARSSARRGPAPSGCSSPASSSAA